MINSLNSILNISLQNKKQVSYKSNSISFMGNNDFFINAPIAIGEIDDFELQDILETIHNKEKITSGYASDIYKVKGKAVKVPKKRDYFDKFQRVYAQEQNLKEYFILSKINDLDSSIAVKPFGVIREKDSYYLIEEFIEGCHPVDSLLNEEHIIDLLKKFVILDKNGIYNCDLQSQNIFLLNDGTTRLIDFGAYNVILNSGKIESLTYLPPAFFESKNGQSKADELMNEVFQKRYVKAIFDNDYKDIKNFSDNPYLDVQSNATNFEFRTLSEYLTTGVEKQPLEFFKNYLKLKAQYYHSQMEVFLKSLNFSEYSLSDIQKERIKKATEYENLISKVLENPSDEIIEIELAKLQLRNFMNPGDFIIPNLDNLTKVKSAYEKLIYLLEQNIQKTVGLEKEYCIQTLDGFKSRFENFKFAPNQIEIPKKENLIDIVYKKTQNGLLSNILKFF